MSSILAPLVIALILGVATTVVLIYAALAVRKARPSERTHMDPLPVALRLIWPVVQVVQFYVRSILSPSAMFKMRRRLQLAGLEYILRAEEFIAVQVCTAALFSFLGFAGARALDADAGVSWLSTTGLMLLGWFYPRLWMAERRKRRVAEVLRSLPSYLDLITLCCHAGLGLTGAIMQAVDKTTDAILRTEFDRVLRDMKAGMTRSDALKAMAHRLDMEHVTSLVSTMIQAEAMGASISDTLSKIAEQRRNERFQAAEKLAMEAPVKLIGPLVMFIFPVTFVIVLFPVVAQFLGAAAG